MTTNPLEENFEDVVYYIIQEIQQEENEHNNNEEETLSVEDDNILVNKIYSGIFTNYIIN